MSISEIGVSNSDDTFGDESMSGSPFIADVKRTCHLTLTVADGKLGTARMIQYSPSTVNFFVDQNLQPLAEWHPRVLVRSTVARIGCALPDNIQCIDKSEINTDNEQLSCPFEI